MAEITRILAANIRRQLLFVFTATASTRCLVQNFKLICYSQRVNAMSQYNDNDSGTCGTVVNAMSQYNCTTTVVVQDVQNG